MTSPDGLRALVPFAHVADLERSIEFYHRLGFRISNADGEPGRRGWVWLTSGRAHVMLLRSLEKRATGSIQLWLYAPDVVAYRELLIARGVEVGPLTHPEHLPKGEFHLEDPDGHHVAVGQWEDDWFGY